MTTYRDWKYVSNYFGMTDLRVSVMSDSILLVWNEAPNVLACHVFENILKAYLRK